MMNKQQTVSSLSLLSLALLIAFSHGFGSSSFCSHRRILSINDGVALFSVIPPCPFTQQPRRQNHRLTSTTSLYSTSRQKEETEKQKSNAVIYQKVVRPPANIPVGLFLSSLVEYLQDHFELPERLPMVYQEETAKAAMNDDEENNNRDVIRWDSPLSPCSASTCLRVQVVAIHTKAAEQNNANSDNHQASMAMVVVNKDDSEPNQLPPLLQSLFADSEKQILRALDQGLDEYASGTMSRNLATIRMAEQEASATTSTSVADVGSSNGSNNMDHNEAFWSELVDDVDGLDDETLMNGDHSNGSTSKSVKNQVLDAEIVPDTKNNDNSVRRKAAMKVIQAKAKVEPLSQKTKDPTGGVDFAVQAAAKQAARRKRVQSRETGTAKATKGKTTTQPGEFAVEAAKKVAKQKKKQTKKSNTKAATSMYAASISSSSSTGESRKEATTAVEQLNISNIRPPSLDPNSSGRPKAFMQSISRPTEFQKNDGRNVGKATKKNDSNNKQPVQAKVKQPQADPRAKKPLEKSDTTPSNPTPVQQGNRKINLNVREEKDAVMMESGKGDDKDDITDPQQKEMIQATQDALTELAEQGKELTPEELLNDVIQFGEEQDRENVVGDGFVSGAFEKAKDILREQRQLREERLQQQVVNQVTANVQEGGATPVAETSEILSPEEELRRMFEAGEQLADGRIATVSQTNKGETLIDPSSRASEEEIDAVIASDKTISSHARILDEELAELEVRINKSPGEEMDGPKQNPIFDIFSGPEVYNPNVDPETAVNWPGALPGTKNVRLPKELDEAVKQARFAAEAIMNLREDEQTDTSGSVTTKYFIGERELKPAQVENLRAVVNEAVEIGLIDDPLNRAAEASRLQMLLDELWNQPEERYQDIISNYKDLLLSDNFVLLVKERLNHMADRDLDALRQDDNSLEEAHSRERELLGQMVVFAQLLLKNARALGAELEAQQLEVIRSICKVAMDPSHQTEEETAMALSDAVRDMRPLLDEAFVAYLKYAVSEEEGRLARAGVLDDPEHNQWLFVLKIVQQGVYTEISRGISRYIDHITYVLRMETPLERRMLLEKLIDVMPTLDVRPFVQVVDNIAGSLGDSARGEFEELTELGEMTNKLLQLHRDMKELLPEERIKEMSRDADEWAAKQKKKMLEQRNLTKKRLKASRQTEHLDGEAETLSRSGEFDRFD